MVYQREKEGHVSSFTFPLPLAGNRDDAMLTLFHYGFLLFLGPRPCLRPLLGQQLVPCSLDLDSHTQPSNHVYSVSTVPFARRTPVPSAVCVHTHIYSSQILEKRGEMRLAAPRPVAP